MVESIGGDEVDYTDPDWGASQLRRLSIFGDLTQDELRELYARGHRKHVRPKSYVVIEGEPTRGLFMLLSGLVSIYKSDESTGGMSRLAMLEEGSYFGELSLFDTSPRSATVLAENACYVFELDADTFEAFLGDGGVERQMRFYRRCARDLCGRFRQLNGDYIASQQLLWKYALRRDDETQGA